MNTEETTLEPAADSSRQFDAAVKLHSLARQLRHLLPPVPDDASIHIIEHTGGRVSVGIHRFQDYESGREFMRALGIHKWDKQVHDPDEPWCNLIGMLTPNIEITAYCSGTPPSCRIVQKTERIPKAQTVETGEYIEVTRSVIECGREEA